MLRQLATFLARRSAAVLVIALLAVPLLAVAGHGVRDRLSVGGFSDPSAESTLAGARLEDVFDAAPPNYVLVVSFNSGSITDPANAATGQALVDEVATRPGVLDVLSPWTLGQLPEGVANPLESATGTVAAIAVRLGGDEDDQRIVADGLADLIGSTDSYDVIATGSAEVSRQAAEQAERDLRRSELIAVPLTLVGLLVAFRGWRAALIPLAVALLAVLGTLAVLRVLASLTTVSVFALNLTTGLGLGLAVDYSLLLVARFREERAAGHGVDEAVSHTVQAAGRTVLFSAATVALSLLALVVFPIPYVRSFAFAGVAVVATAGLAAVLVVPALLTCFGSRLGQDRRRPDAEGWWGRQAARVVRRPLAWSLAVVVVLVAVGMPFLGLNAGRIDERVLPETNGARAGAELLRRGFEIGEFNPISVSIPWLDARDPVDAQELGDLVDSVLALPDVARVDSAFGFATSRGVVPPTAYNDRFVGGPEAGTWVSVVTLRDPSDSQAEVLVRSIRSLDDRIAVSGTTATVVDTVDSVTDRVPLTLALIAVTTLLLLFAMTGSIVVPIKALLVNLLSLTATFGSLVWIFQDGHLADLLNVTPNGRLDVFTPILMLCVAFGLSMDYEVFLLARIKESYDLTGDNATSIVDGLGHTGRVVSAAAGLLAVVFVAIATSGVMTVKMFGFGLAVAILVDAFLIRGTLVPAMMRVAGDTNWWAPRPLRRLHLRWGLWEPQLPPADGLDVIRSGSDVVVRRLASSSSFAGCTPSDIRIVARHAVHVSAVAGTLVSRRSEAGDAVVVLLHGEVAEVMTDSTGLIEVTSHGRVFGPGALLVTRCAGANRNPALIALTRCELAVFDRSRFSVLRRELPIDPESGNCGSNDRTELTNAAL